MRFLHSADWQIGKVFKRFGAKEQSLRQARLMAIETLGRLAREHGARHVLVAGDVYDSEAPGPITLREPIERMKSFADVHWHLLPGNHDPHRPEGLWDRVAQLGLPPHVHAHLAPTPFLLEDGAFLLPAPLARKSEYNDLTEWMEHAETPVGALRIGLAHGAVTHFQSEGEAANPIDPARPAIARLDYLALGDWHRTMRVGPRVWYAGTPEPDRAGGQERGIALLVDIAGSGATPTVAELSTGVYRWLSRTETVGDAADLVALETRLRAEGDLSRMILRLRLEGALPLDANADLRRRLRDIEAAVFHLEIDEAGLVARPSAADLEAIDFDGVLRHAADRLKAMSDDPSLDTVARHRAEAALVDLYLRVAAPRGEAA